MKRSFKWAWNQCWTSRFWNILPILTNRGMNVMPLQATLVPYFLSSAFAKLWIAAVRPVNCVRPPAARHAWNNSPPTGWIFMKFYIWVFFFSKICRENSSFIKNQTRITDTLHEDQCPFMTRVSNPWPASLYYTARSHLCKWCIHYKIKQFFGPFSTPLTCDPRTSPLL